MLGAGLDTFALRCAPEIADRLTVFEIDVPQTQAWKRRRFAELGWAEPAHLRFVPVDFESGQSWVEAIGRAGFDRTRPAVVSALGVTQYLTEQATTTMLAEVAGLAPGSVFVCGFNPPDDAAPAAARPLLEQILKMVADSGCPWIGRYTGEDLAARALAAGFTAAELVDAAELGRRYFRGRPIGLRPWVLEEFLVARTG